MAQQFMNEVHIFKMSFKMNLYPRLNTAAFLNANIDRIVPSAKLLIRLNYH